MSFINEDFFDSIVYIYQTEEEAVEGGVRGASGFFASVWDSEEYGHIYAVTNAHVTEQFHPKDRIFLRINRNDGLTHILSTVAGDWTTHIDGDDLAIYYVCNNLDLPKEWRFKCVLQENILQKDEMEDRSIGVGDVTYTFGRYSNHSGKFFNRPAVRFGHISMLPFERISQGKKRSYEQESFLVETHSVNGFSGSPVFIALRPDGRPAKNPVTKKMTFLLGVDWGHFDFSGEIIIGPGTTKLTLPSGMMCVVPAWKLNELLMDEEVVLRRQSVSR